MPLARKQDSSGKDLDTICQHCGQALSDFLHRMEEHNAEVVCPSCGKKHVSGGKAAGSRGKPTQKQ
jgi:predicted RNA-binding Zn-ribbon protein involved in translation (DUF1610 family)